MSRFTLLSSGQVMIANRDFHFRACTCDDKLDETMNQAIILAKSFINYYVILGYAKLSSTT